jgi:hypothetical protein
MRTHGLPERFWVVTKPSPVSAMEDVCFPCTFQRLIDRVRGGLDEEEIVGVFADETEARKEAAELLGEYVVRPEDALFAEVVVNVMVKPKVGDLTAGELGEAAVEAVRNAVRQGEDAGFQHGLQGQVSLGAGTVELRNEIVVGSRVVLSEIEPREVEQEERCDVRADP